LGLNEIQSEEYKQPQTGPLLDFNTSTSFYHRWRGSATDKVLEKRTILWILGDKRPNSSWNSGQVAFARLGFCARQCGKKICLGPRFFRRPVRAQSGGIGSGGESSLGKRAATLLICSQAARI
jgi:hypothetical protein